MNTQRSRRKRQMRKIFSLSAASTTTGPPVCPPRIRHGSALLDWLAWAELEIDNIRAVLQGCVARHDSRARIGYRGLAALLLGYPRHHGERSLAGPTAGLRRGLSADAGQRYYLRGWLSVLQADPAAARPWLARAVAQLEEPAPRTGRRCRSANVEDMLGNPAGARHFLDEADAMPLKRMTIPRRSSSSRRKLFTPSSKATCRS